MHWMTVLWLFHAKSSIHIPEWSQRYFRIAPMVHRTDPPLLLLICPYSNGDFVSMMRFSAGVSPCHWYRSTIWVSSCLAKCKWISKAYQWLSEREIFSTFQDIFQFGIIPFPFIEEMCNCGTVAWAVFFKVNRFPMISKRKNGYQYSHDMLHGGLWKDTA